MDKGPSKFFPTKSLNKTRKKWPLARRLREMLAQTASWNNVLFFFWALEEFDPLRIMSWNLSIP